MAHRMACSRPLKTIPRSHCGRTGVIPGPCKSIEVIMSDIVLA